jgi:phytoene dehydrogenase-like protein
MAQKTILIIGGGIAGLAAGCYAQMNGFRSHIFERHFLPGGLCTSWQRKGYTFDGCLQYLFGSAPGQPYAHLWQELGAAQNRRMIDHDAFMHVVDRDGTTVAAYADPDRLADHLLTLAPEDAAAIRGLAHAIRVFTRFDLSLLQITPRPLMGLLGFAALGSKMLPFVPATAAFGLDSAASYARRLRNPALRRAFPHLFGWSEIPMIAALSLMAYMHRGNASFPAGGSLAFAQAIEQRYRELGGEITYKADVERVLVENDRAVGLRLYDNTEIRGDYVISAADGRTTLFDMLDGQYINRRIRRLYSGRLPIRSQIQVSLGVARDLSAEPHWATYLLDDPLRAGGKEHRAIAVKHYCFDPCFAPVGKSAVAVMLPSDYGYWQRIYGRRLYDTEQLQEVEPVIAFLDRRYPGLADQIEVLDVATPISYKRYTGNWLGATSGWLPSQPVLAEMLLGVPKTLPGLANFYMAGQWVEPGGSVPLAAMSGRNALQLICAAEKQPFSPSTSLEQDTRL